MIQIAILGYGTVGSGVYEIAERMRKASSASPGRKLW